MAFKQTMWGGADEMVAKEGIIEPIDLGDVPNFNASMPELETQYVFID